MKKSKNNSSNDFVTKSYFDERLKVTEEHFEKKLDNKIEATRKSLDDKIEITKNDLKKYVDEKLANNTSKIIGYVDMKFQLVDEKFEK